MSHSQEPKDLLTTGLDTPFSEASPNDDRLEEEEDFESIRQYFSPHQFEVMSSYEKMNYMSKKENYDRMQDLGKVYCA